MPNCDPSTLANAARCFNCVIPVGDQLAVQSYVLAKLVGYATDSDGANQLANDARCFSCTIPPGDLLAVQTYLISLLSETTIAATDLPNAARCFMSCVPLGEQNALKTYLLDQVDSLGGITISTDPAVLVNDARCISCVVPISDQTAVQTWLLALLANVDTTDPSGIANSARCYASCIPIGDQIPVQNYLLCQTQTLVTPPCVTPAAPFFVQVAQRGVTDPNTQLSVRWQQLPNTGSLITSYTVKWGTTAGGPYTNNSGSLPINPKFYVATGLTPGTTYYFVVVANSFSGCSSANSVEANGTPAPGSGLLTGLVSYWQIDGAIGGGIPPDSQDGNTLTVTGGTINAVGGPLAGTGYFGMGGFPDRLSIAVTPANMRLGAGKSFSIQIWFNPTGAQADNNCIVSQYSNVILTSAYILIFLTNQARVAGFSTDGSAVGVNIGLPNLNVWNHIVFGYDASTSKLFGQLNGAARVTQATTADLNSAATEFDIGTATALNYFGGGVGQSGFWNRVLSTTDVANLYNGGAGLPFSSFT